MGVRISDLPVAESIDTTEVIIISGEETKQMTYASLIAQLTEDLNIGSGGGSAVIESLTWRGLTVRMVSDGIFASVSIVGRTNAAITTKDTWTTIGVFPSIAPQSDVVGYQIVSGSNTLRYRVAADGTLQIGYGRVTTTGATTDIASGGVLDLLFTYAVQ